MATSGTINGTISGYRPYLRLNWSRVETDVGGNRSKLRLQLYLMHPYTVKYSTTKSGVLQGTSFSSSTRVNGTGSTLLRTQDVWVGHNSDGSKTQRLSASFNIAISYSGSKLNQLTVSGDAHITAIPRASTLSAFSFNTHLKNGVANQINYTIDRRSDPFRHQIQLRDGNTTVRTWDNQSSDGKSTLPLTANEVNTLLNRMSGSTTKSYTLRVATRSGNNGGWIGSAVSRNATATVHADVKPTVGAVSLSQTGNSVSTHYLQGKSRVKAEFTRSAGYGATIASSSIQVRRVSGGADSQIINSYDGTTENAVSLSGSYQARGTAKDTRGRITHTEWVTFTVTPYSAPRITNFTAVRDSDAETTIVVTRNGTHTSLGRANSARMLIQKRTGTGSWDTVEDISDTAGVWSKSINSTDNSETSSYEFRATLTDAFGESATATVTVSTQRVVLDIHKNEGVGIGKIHEKGVLDVDGEIHLRGGVFMTGEPTSGKDFQLSIDPESGNSAIELGATKHESTPFIDFHSSGFANDRDSRIISRGGINGQNGRGNLEFEGNDIHMKPRNRALINGDDIVGYGNNERGHWIRYYDGSQICWGRNPITTPVNIAHGGSYRSASATYAFPIPFEASPTPMVSVEVFDAWSTLMTRNPTVNFSAMFFKGSSIASFETTISYLAIGRWKS